MSAWNDRRPLFARLPQYGWKDNPIADAVTAPFDEIFVDLKETIERFDVDFIDPETCRVDALDWLAQLCGYTDEYWDSSWPDTVKRQLIVDHQMIWGYKGTQWVLEYMLNLFELNARVRIRGAWRAGVSKPGDVIGGDLLHYSIVVDGGYVRGGTEWRLIDRLRRLYAPVWCKAIADPNFLHFDRFRAGRSVAGDPI